MGAYLRIKWLHEQLLNERYPNARSLANKFEISHRQGQRDFEYMRDSLGAPLDYIQAKRGYRYLADFVLPTYFVGDRDREILWQLSDYYDGLAEIGYEHYEGYAELLERLSGGKPRLNDVKARPTVPYRAIIDFGEGRSYFRLLQRYCVKGPEGGRAVYEFDRPEVFLGLLFATGVRFRIVEPAWLREKLREHARMVLERNNEDATW